MNHRKHTDTLCKQNAELSRAICTNQWALSASCSLLLVCELTHICICKENNSRNCVEHMRRHCTKFVFLQFEHPCEWSRNYVISRTSEHVALALVFLRYKLQASSLLTYVSILFLLFLFPVCNKHATIHTIRSNSRHLPQILHLRRALIPHSQRTTNHQELATSSMTQSSSPSLSSPTTEKCRSSPPLNTTHPNYVICHLSTPRPEYSYQFIPNQQWATGKLVRPNERHKPTDNRDKGGPWWARLRQRAVTRL